MNARARRANNNLRLFEDFYEPLGGDPGFPPVAGVEGRLPATGLIRGAVDGKVQLIENLQHGLADFGIEAVDQALDKKRYFLGAVFHRLKVYNRLQDAIPRYIMWRDRSRSKFSPQTKSEVRMPTLSNPLRELIDGHAHLNEIDDIEGALERAAAAGVERIVAVGMDIACRMRAIIARSGRCGQVGAAGGEAQQVGNFTDAPVMLAQILSRQ